MQKVVCPGNRHEQFKYTKFLFGFEERVCGAPLVFYVHCDDMNCKTWFKITFVENGSYYAEALPKDYHINFKKIPVPVKC